MTSNKNNHILHAFIALLLLGATGALYANDDEPEEWLTRMTQSIHKLNFEGTFIYSQATHLHVMAISHTATDDGEFERLTSKTGVQRDVFRSDNLVTCILPDSRSVIVERNDKLLKGNLPITLPDLNLIKQYYDIELKDTARIAGRMTQRVDVIPRDNLRYTHSYWIDQENGMLLKSALYDEHNQLIEWFMFTDIEFPDEIPMSRFKPEIKDKNFVWYRYDDKQDDDSKNSELDHWHATQLPAGFRQLDHRRQYKYPDPRPIEHLVFSDGMSMVSVFIEKLAPQEEPLIGPTRVGAVNTYGQVIGEYQITVVGEVPMATVMAIANSIKRD